MKGHVRERGKGRWYAVIETRDGAGKRKRKWVSHRAQSTVNIAILESPCALIQPQPQGESKLHYRLICSTALTHSRFGSSAAVRVSDDFSDFWISRRV